MSEVFLKIVNMGISAGWLVLAVLLLRLLLRRAPRWTHVLMWGLVGIRLLCPFSVESVLSLIPSAETIPGDVLSGPSFQIQTGIAPVDSRINDYLGDRYFEGVSVPADNGSHVTTILAGVWIAGILLLVCGMAFSYWRLRKNVRTAVLLRENIFQSEHVTSPFVLGIFAPRIYLPFRMDARVQKQVIAHEQAHIRRGDHLWKMLGFLLLAVYWFHPLMWVAYVMLCRDMEFACDEKVIRDLGNGQRADYMEALLACSTRGTMIAACPLAFGEVRVKERVRAVMDYRKPALGILLIAIFACLLLAACFLTNPVQDEMGVFRFVGNSVQPAADEETADLEQYRTQYIGDAPKVSAIAQRLPYPAGYSYASIELQTAAEPYELMVYLNSDGSGRTEGLRDCAAQAFDLVGNMGRISFWDADTGAGIAAFERE